MEERIRKVAVVGGGITGLTAAYFLQKQAHEQGLPIHITLIEAAHRLGGKIQTLQKDGFVIERGPDSFLSFKNSIGRLAKELGIADKLVRGVKGQWSIVAEDKLQPIPEGTIMGVPTNLGAFLTSDLFSWSGKVRAAGDLVLPKAAEASDQSLGKFMRRRFGKELVENLLEPLLSGANGGDIDRMSLEAAFPQFAEVEQKHRSLMTGMKKTKAGARAAVYSRNEEDVYQTFEGGLQTLVEALEKKLSGCTILKGVKVDGIKAEAVKASLKLNNSSTILVDQVLFALPHSKLLPLFEPYDLLNGLKEMPMTSIATISMVFPESAVEFGESTGFVVARNSDFAITACSWPQQRWPSIAVPEGKKMLRAFIGRVGDEAVVDLADHEIEKIVLSDLRKMMKIEGKPDFIVVSRWKQAMPQYVVGHKKRVAEAKKELEKEFPMVQLAGSSFGGFDLADCAEQGKIAACRIVEQLLG
ncbi:protoporphyrinogen oxidase [Planomicrobium soli]|uniref:Coproporphyrinogen III oxidase n=1 Tax=Planomicrobium soli TaxID=1176648 RepID=A0A2P8G9J9_9BACL|nr:protoporphyrinogen oxidase [Planomicrobium soli]PSL30638.1 protoporphyrinogen oxidase [Planomicrobium soli]